MCLVESEHGQRVLSHIILYHPQVAHKQYVAGIVGLNSHGAVYGLDGLEPFTFVTGLVGLVDRLHVRGFGQDAEAGGQEHGECYEESCHKSESRVR